MVLLQLTMVAVGALPLLISSSVWLSWTAGGLSMLVSMAVVLKAVATRSPSGQWMTVLFSTLLWVLPIAFGKTYLARPDRGWDALVQVWPLVGAFGSVIVFIACLGTIRSGPKGAAK